MKTLPLTVALLLCPLIAAAQLAVTASAPKATGTKSTVSLGLKNTFAEPIESARATVFLVNEQGKVVGQATQWVIGGTKDKPPLPSDKETTFHFVIPTDKPFKETRITFTRLILQGGKSVDPARNVILQQK
ncbi:MAG: hypothetical protein AB1705_21260 [Verrucomicrobiota bacterium]